MKDKNLKFLQKILEKTNLSNEVIISVFSKDDRQVIEKAINAESYDEIYNCAEYLESYLYATTIDSITIDIINNFIIELNKKLDSVLESRLIDLSVTSKKYVESDFIKLQESNNILVLAAILQNSKIYLSILKGNQTIFSKAKAISYIFKQFDVKEGKAKDQGNLDLKIDFEVRTRFAPEPSGYLHLGHSKACLLNNYYAENYNGKLRIRFDDTNPSKESMEFQIAITEDLAMLGVSGYTVTNTSNYFDVLIEYCANLIKMGKAYCDDSTKISEERNDGIENSNRSNTIEENLEIFETMKLDKTGYCVRAKIDMKANNRCMRDPVIYRHNLDCHYITGLKYKIYPTYDFACPIVDFLEDVSLVLRSNEFRDRNEIYFWILDTMKIKRPRIQDFSRLNFEDTHMSKRKLRGLSTWDDPRMPTLRGIRRKGLRFDVLKEYVLMQGIKQKSCIVSWDKIWALNKRRLEDESKKLMCVKKQDAVEVVIEVSSLLCVDASINDSLKKYDLEINTYNGVKEIPYNRKNLDLGNKKMQFSNFLLIDQEDAQNIPNGEFTLMHLSNAVVTQKEEENGKIKKIYVKLQNGSVKDTLKVSWINKLGAVAMEIREFGLLLKDGDFNEDGISKTEYLAETSLCNINEGDIVQFERNGFYFCDGGYVFNLVPFTKQVRKY